MHRNYTTEARAPQYTVWPMFRLINELPKEYLTAKELKNFIIQARALSTQTEIATPAIGHAYARISAAVQAELKAGEVSKTRLREIVDQILRAEGWGYARYIHAPLCSNHFYSSEISQIWDWGFYNPQDPIVGGHVHRQAGRPSSFYARVEWRPQEDEMLIGNIQHAYFGQNMLSLGRINNLRAVMVHEILRQAVRTGVPRIVFQSGDAMQIAQFNARRICSSSEQLRSIMRQPEPYAQFWRQAFEHIFQKNKLTAEQLFSIGGEIYRVVARTGATIKIFPFNLQSRVFFPLLHLFYYCAAVHAAQSPVRLFGAELMSAPLATNYALVASYKIFNQFDNLGTLVAAVQEYDYPRIYAGITAIFSALTGVTTSDPRREEKLKFLESTRGQYPGIYSGALQYLANFLETFDYNTILLDKFKFLARNPAPTARQDFRYIHQNFSNEYFTINPDNLTGRTVGAGDTGDLQQLASRRALRPPAAQGRPGNCYELYRFYEKEIPKILTQGGINFKTRPLIALKHKGLASDLNFFSYGWEITDPPEKILAQPIPLF